MEEEIKERKMNKEKYNQWYPVILLFIILLLLILIVVMGYNYDAQIEKYNILVRYVTDTCFCNSTFVP